MYTFLVRSIQFSHSVMSNSLQPHGPQHTRPPCLSPTFGVYSNSSIESVMRSNHLILCRPLLLPPSIFPSIRVSSNESVLHIGWSKYCSFSLSISPSNEYSGLISFRMYWLDRLNGKPLQYFCLENSMNTMKRQLVLPRKIFLGLTLSCAFSLDANLGLDLLFSLFSLSSRSFHYYINESPKLWQLDFPPPILHSLASPLTGEGKPKERMAPFPTERI